ncbi:UDP-N-acetylglucosamine diphosphorylase 2 [Capsicum annuum]|nr:UDP-N-acetylglucosamine diphosphorylase 2 [Capsicum annuum]
MREKDIGLPSGKSLFHLQAERILCIQRLAAITANEGAGIVPIQWYIMTSPFTDEATRKYFESHKYFGLEPDQVTFFQQGTIPCVSKDGRFIMETPYRVAKSPDGNGGVYTGTVIPHFKHFSLNAMEYCGFRDLDRCYLLVVYHIEVSQLTFELFPALKSSRLLEEMNTRGIKYVDCYGVDNALVRVADPTFLGYFIDKGVSAAAKVVRKAYPQEKVGVFVRRGKGGPLAVVEYSELDPSLCNAVNQETGRLRFCWSNVCLHMFTVDFLNQVANGLEKDSIYHLAEKKIPSIHGQTVGYKLEQFIFDAFPYTPSTTLYEVVREEEFAPVKNANGANFDTPDSARLLVLRLHTRWVVAAGGFLTHSVPLYATGVEVSPLCSYAGENLEAICRGRTFHAPCEISFYHTLPMEKPKEEKKGQCKIRLNPDRVNELASGILQPNLDDATFRPTDSNDAIHSNNFICGCSIRQHNYISHYHKWMELGFAYFPTCP